MTLVVRRRRPFLVLGAVAVAALAAGGGAWWTLSQDGREADNALFNMRLERDELARSSRKIESERDALLRRVAVLERARQVESAAYARVDEQLADLNEQLLAMKEEVTFYKGIVGEDQSAAGVRIQRFEIESQGGGREYRFRLVLTRGIRNDNVASGAVTLAVEGDQDGERVRLALDELMSLPAGHIEYSFKHFQRLEGRLQLPPRFVPKRVIVRVDSARPGSKPLRESYKWPSMES